MLAVRYSLQVGCGTRGTTSNSRRDERADAERLAAEVVEVGTNRGTPSTHRGTLSTHRGTLSTHRGTLSTHRGTLSTHRGYSRRDKRADAERLAAQVVEVLVVRERRHLRRYDRTVIITRCNAVKFDMIARS